MANTSGWYYSIEGNRAVKDKRKGQWNQFYFQKNKKYQNKISKKLKQPQTISNNLKKSQKISNNLKKQKNSKYLKNSLMLFLKRGFARLGPLLHIFLDHRKSQKKTKSFRFAEKSKKIKNKIKPNKLMQTYKTLDHLCDSCPVSSSSKMLFFAPHPAPARFCVTCMILLSSFSRKSEAKLLMPNSKPGNIQCSLKFETGWFC